MSLINYVTYACSIVKNKKAISIIFKFYQFVKWNSDIYLVLQKSKRRYQKRDFNSWNIKTSDCKMIRTTFENIVAKWEISLILSNVFCCRYVFKSVWLLYYNLEKFNIFAFVFPKSSVAELLYTWKGYNK